MGALGAGLALPFFLGHAGPVDAASSGPAAVSAVPDPASQAQGESALSRWRGYALASITPQFSWALRPASYGPPDVLDSVLERRGGFDEARPVLFRLPQGRAAQIDVSIATGRVSDTPSVMPSQAGHLFELPQSGLQRTVVAPSIAREWGHGGSVRLTGVLAYQRFASLGLGTMSAQWAPPPSWWSDNSYGVGGRVDVGNTFGGGRWSWTLGYQSRVSMGTFSNYRGVFADRGDFDIPASASAGIGYALTPNFGIDVGVQRVQYGAITPFASPSLPTRFLALLGDGASPNFRWQDLNVYSVGWTLRDDDLGSFQLRYTTRQQPQPTSKLLQRALESVTANDMIAFGWSRPFGARANLSVAATYATSPYYLMMPTTYSTRDAIAGQFEFEALWSLRF